MELDYVINAVFNVKIVVNHKIIVRLVKAIEELVSDLYQFHFVPVKMENLMMVLV